MRLDQFKKISDYEWHIEPLGQMRVPGVIYATADLVEGMDQKVFEQVSNVATLPGIEVASFAMPDAHWGYGFPIGGVAAFDADRGGVVSAGGVGFDISCGVRNVETGLKLADIEPIKEKVAHELYRQIPAGVGSKGHIHLTMDEMDEMLEGGAQWAVNQGYGLEEDLERIEERGRMAGAQPEFVSDHAKKRQQDEMGTLGSGNHYLEVQCVREIYRPEIAESYGIGQDDIIVSIHCGSRGLGHQIGADYLKTMLLAAREYGIELPERELACAPIKSEIGQQYLGAMRAGINCALANRQIITHLARESFRHLFPGAQLDLLYDVSHNTCKEEEHTIGGKLKKVYVHRKGATRAYGPATPEMKAIFGQSGQPVLIGGSMGTSSYVLAGTDAGMGLAFGSACHGAGRAMSRHEALRHWQGRQLIDALAEQGIIIKSHTSRGVAEEAPGAYKNVDAVVDAADRCGLAYKVAKLVPLICVKG